MSRRRFTRRSTPPEPERFKWLVLWGTSADHEEVVEMSIPDEQLIRSKLGIPPSEPVLIGSCRA